MTSWRLLRVVIVLVLALGGRAVLALHGQPPLSRVPPTPSCRTPTATPA